MNTIEARSTGELVSVDTCPTCKLAIHPMPESMLVVAAIGTYTDHCHVICPCGWWVQAGAADMDRVALEHFKTHTKPESEGGESDG